MNVDENPEIAARFGVRGIPMLAMFKGGELADQLTGARPKSQLSAWINGAA